jgi:FkbM family methyltransferase
MGGSSDETRRGLIYDVGVCNGDDSAYYLHKGYRVVGIEANPLLIPALRDRFAAEIREGRYELQHVGIAPREGEAQFWVCDDWPEWSSFDRAVASRNGSRHHAVTVKTSRFATLLDRFGPGAYCKIDIEGNDNLCLDDMSPATRPTYLSVEIDTAEPQIRRLQELGYSRFKLISQTTFRQPDTAITALKTRIPASAARLITRAEARLARFQPEAGWRFRYGSSGPFGEESHGPWRTAEQALALDRLLEAGDHFAEWCDIHAA